MIRRHDKEGVVRDAGFFQAVHQLCQPLLQFQPGGDVRLRLVGVRKIRHFLPVPAGHLVAVIPVGKMHADGQIIDVEWLLFHVVVKGLLHHVGVRLGPEGMTAFVCLLCHGPPASVRLAPLIPQVRMGQLPAVHVLVKMVADGGIPVLLQRVRQREGKPGAALPALRQADREARLRVESGQVLELPARCACKMKR